MLKPTIIEIRASNDMLPRPFHLLALAAKLLTSTLPARILAKASIHILMAKFSMPIEGNKPNEH